MNKSQSTRKQASSITTKTSNQRKKVHHLSHIRNASNSPRNTTSTAKKVTSTSTRIINKAINDRTTSPSNHTPHHQRYQHQNEKLWANYAPIKPLPRLNVPLTVNQNNNRQNNNFNRKSLQYQPIYQYQNAYFSSVPLTTTPNQHKDIKTTGIPAPFVVGQVPAPFENTLAKNPLLPLEKIERQTNKISMDNKFLETSNNCIGGICVPSTPLSKSVD